MDLDKSSIDEFIENGAGPKPDTSVSRDRFKLAGYSFDKPKDKKPVVSFGFHFKVGMWPFVISVVAILLGLIIHQYSTFASEELYRTTEVELQNIEYYKEYLKAKGAR